jgi:tetratricopeptide (TPR) repeat protein
MALTQEDEPAGAMEAYRKAIQVAPAFVQPHVNLGLLLERQGDRDGAIAEWRWVERNASPDHPDERPLRLQALALLERFPPAAATEGEEETGSHGEAPGPGLEAEGSPRVTVIVTPDGVGQDLEGCLENLAGQSLFREGAMEVLVVAGAFVKSDETIIFPFLEAFPDQVHYVQARSGATRTGCWNLGVKRARGAYLITSAPGGRHAPEALAALAGALDDHPERAVVYGDEEITAGGTPEAPVKVAFFAWPEFEPRHLFEGRHLGRHPMWRRELHGRHGYFDAEFRTAGDYEFWLRLVAAGELFLHLPRIVGTVPSGSPDSPTMVLAAAESHLARVRNWPESWGPLPPQRGNYRFTAGR